MPHAYRVSVGTNPTTLDGSALGGASRVTLHSRLRTIDAVHSESLDLFLRSYTSAGAYLLAPASRAENCPATFDTDLALLKRDLVVRPAWQVGVRDIDSAMIFAEDDPIVPQGVEFPPVAALLDRRRAERD